MYQHKKWCLKLQEFGVLCLLYGWIPLLLVLFFYVVPFVIVPAVN